MEIQHEGQIIKAMRELRGVTIQQVADALEKTDAYIERIENSIVLDYFDLFKFTNYYHWGFVTFPSENSPDLTTAPPIKDANFVFKLGKELIMPERPPFSQIVAFMRVKRGLELETVAQQLGKTVAQIQEEEANRFMAYHDFRVWANLYDCGVRWLQKEFLPLDEPEPPQ